MKTDSRTNNGMDISGKTKERKIKNNRGDGNMEGDKWEEFGKRTMEQQTRMAIRDQTTAQNILIRNYIYTQIVW